MQTLISRRLCARLLSTLICSTLIVLRSFSRLGGEYAFLALVIKELVFSPDHTIAHQLEKTVLHFFLGTLVGVGFSMLAKYLASFPSPQSTLARTTPALLLILICFIAGFVKSRFRRLTLSARIACFISVWMLTADIGDVQNYLPEGVNFLWVTLTAAITALFASLLCLRWTCPQLVYDISSALAALRHGMELNFQETLSSNPHPKSRVSKEVHHNILQKSIELNTTYRRTSFQLGLGRVSVKSLKPLLGTIEHLRRELSWGIAPRPFHVESQSEPSSFVVHTQELVDSVVESIKVIETVILACYQQIFSSSLNEEKSSLSASQKRLRMALEGTLHELKIFCENPDTTQHQMDRQISFPQKVFDACLFTVLLLQMANDTERALVVCEELIKSHEASRPRLWFPQLTADWFGGMQRPVLIEEYEDILDDGTQDTTVRESSSLSIETRTLKATSENSNDGAAEGSPIETSWSAFPSYQWIWRVILYLWNRPRCLQARLLLSRIVCSVNHSSHFRHALKNAVGVALLSIPAFYPPDSSARQWFMSSRGQWLLISYLWVLETDTGATSGLLTNCTILGALYGYVAATICRSNPYRMVVMMTVAEIPLSWVIINTTYPPMGTVASVTIPPILFANYFHSDLPTAPIYLSVLSGIMVTGGIIAALLMNSLVFPRHCHVLFLDNVCSSLRMVSRLYMALGCNLFQRGYTPNNEDKQNTLKLELKIRSSLHLLSILICTMSDEVSLVPKPTKHYRETLCVLQTFLDLLIGLRKVRPKIPWNETVLAVLPHRRELVSSICMSLFACEQAFGARQPLPQFLPSARQAFEALDLHMENEIRRSRATDTACMGLSLAYAFAEMDILGRLVDTNEELLDLTRRLFGTSVWFHEEFDSYASTQDLEEQMDD